MQLRCISGAGSLEMDITSNRGMIAAMKGTARDGKFTV
jgi:hypothetical protein